MDLNHDGEITVDEFVHYCRSHQSISESMMVSEEDRLEVPVPDAGYDMSPFT